MLYRRFSTLVLAAAVPLAACRPTPLQTAQPMEEAAAHVREGRGAPRELALAGFEALLVRSDVTAAQSLFKKALAADANEPWAHYGLSELARRSLDTRGRVKEGLAVCAAAPMHPLCAVAARTALDTTGDSPGLDTDIEVAARKGLTAGATGEAAFLLRQSIAQVLRNRGDEKGASETLADAGAMSRAALLGPYAAHHYLEFDQPFAPEQGEIPAKATGPAGDIVPRTAEQPDGRLILYSEPTQADVFYFASDVTVAEPGRYLVTAFSTQSMKVFVDGALVGERRTFDDYGPRELASAVQLGAGKHRVVMKLARGSDRGEVWLSLPREDGRPAKLAFAPASGTFKAEAPEKSASALAFPSAQSVVDALAPEAGGAIAAFVASRDAQERDDQGARRLADALAKKLKSAAVLVLHAESVLADRATPARLNHGDAQRDLDAAVKLDPGEASALQRLSVQARSDNRLDEAADLLAKATKVGAPNGWRLILSEARLAQARGLDALADEAAARAVQLEPHQCDALVLRYELARRQDAVALADSLVNDLDGCPGNKSRKADHLRARGDIDGARAAYESIARERPFDPAPRQTLAQLANAQGRPADAAKLYAELLAQWPRAAFLHKNRADTLERLGDAKGARAEREAALALDGSDVRLRRALAIEDGTDVLDDMKVDGKKVIAEYESKPRQENSSSVYVLDGSAMEANPDGSVTERTHVVAKVLDQRGVAKLAEVHLPSGAEVLSLRTIKRDGRVLEPESVGDKDGISLPGVEVGDYIEYEFLSASPARGPAVPGFAMAKFYFRITDGQIFKSVYDVRAPAGTNMAADLHHADATELKKDAKWERLTFLHEDLPTFIAEPGQPGSDEVLPFVQVGTGAGTEAMLTSFADLLLDRAKPTPAIEAFAQKAGAGLKGEVLVKALYDAVMDEVKGREGAITSTAAATLAQGRGSRMLLLRAALEASGVKTHLALSKTVSSDPAAYKFPNADQYSTPVLVAQVDGRELWLDPSVRFAPFGRVAPQAEGQEVAVLPNVGEALRLTKTPSNPEADRKTVTLKLALAADGTLSGEGEERYNGFDAAYLRSGLERIDQEHRQQAIESSIARVFRGATLESFDIADDEKSGAPLAIRFKFAAPGFARADGNRLVIPEGIYPSSLSRRYLALSERRTPLFIGGAERMELTAELALPKGMKLATPPQTAKVTTDFGSFERQEIPEPGKLKLTEKLTLPMGRVAPERYPLFADFLSSIDRAEMPEWTIQ